MQKLLVLTLVMAIGTIVFVQGNATNQTNSTSPASSSGPIYGSQDAQAAPDQTKFCADFNNDDGTVGTSCEYKSQGECKKGSIAAGDDFRDCHKRDKPSNGGDGDADEEGGGQGPEVPEEVPDEEPDTGSN